jgi:ribosome-associated protein
MDIRKLQRAIVDGLEDVKAQHIVVFNTEALSPLFERVIIASGTSNRQTKALAASVRDAVKAKGLPVLRTEGEEHGEWIIVDCGAAVAHIMQPTVRDYYRLEEIWGGKPVKLKRAEVSTTLPKASEPARAQRARKTAATAAGARMPARKASPAKKASSSRKTAAPKAPVKRNAAVVSKAPAARKPAAGSKAPLAARKSAAVSKAPAARKSAAVPKAPPARKATAAPKSAASRSSATARKAAPAHKAAARGRTG